MEWKASEKRDNNLTKIPKRWLLIHYYEALNILFRFENSLRVFVYAVLKNELFEKWVESSFSIGNGDAQSIKGISNKRISQAEQFGYLGYDIRAPLMHLTSGELIELVMSESNWPKFKPYFRGDRGILKNKLLEIGSIRNSLAHFRPIKEDDIELVKQNARHTLIGVEKCLQSVFSQHLRVPTNTSTDWYKAFSTLGNQYLTTTLHYSESEEWVNVKVTFSSPVFKKEKYFEHYFNYTMATLNSPKILLEQKAIRSRLTFLSERVNYPALSAEYDVSISKELNFVFRKDVLTENYKEIAEGFGSVFLTVAEECELLRQDTLARGRIVQTTNAAAYWVKPSDADGRWNFHYDNFLIPYASDHPDEYWGQQESPGDVVGSMRRYPWMPDDISQIENWND